MRAAAETVRTSTMNVTELDPARQARLEVAYSVRRVDLDGAAADPHRRRWSSPQLSTAPVTGVPATTHDGIPQPVSDR